MKAIKRWAAAAVCAALTASLITLPASAAESTTYTCDFTKLVTNNADTTYGTSADIVKLDDYTTATLTYTGTYVAADGKVHLKSTGTGNSSGAFKNGSYISFTAPSDGTLVVTGYNLSLYEDDTYTKVYNKTTVNFNYTAASGKTYAIGVRDSSADSYVASLAFTPKPEEENPAFASYTAAEYAGVNSRVKAPSTEGLPLIVYLSGSSCFGTNNSSQLNDAQYLFALFDDNAVLAAPQTETAWDTEKLAAYILAARSAYKASSVVVAGQSEGADAAYALAERNAADKIIPIAGTSDIKSTTAKVWAFGGFLDDTTPVADIRKPVNALQQAGADVRYTEYPTEGHSIAEKAAAQTGLAEWILGDVSDPKVVDLVLFSGQSNMAGRGTAADATECPPGYGYEFHSVTDPLLVTDGTVPYVLSTVSEPFGKNDNNSSIHDNSGRGYDRRSGDMVSSVMRAYYEETGVPMVGVQASRGGEPSSFFADSTRKAEMAARFKAAEEYLAAAGYKIRKKAAVWCQGETDADDGRSESSYKSNTLAIWNNFKTMGITDMFIVKTGHYNIYYNTNEPTEAGLTMDARYKAVNTWQQEFADANDNVYAAADLYTDGYLAQMRDQYHYYQPVYNEIGTTVGQYIANIYRDEPIPGESYSWDFSSDQTAASGNNTPIVSGTAVYDETNKNIKFAADTTTAGSLSVNLSPAAEGVITTSYDLYIGNLGGQTFTTSYKDSDGTEIVSLSFDSYNSTGAFKVNGVTVAENGEIKNYLNSNNGDGMKSGATSFRTEIDYAKRTVSLTITKSASSSATYTGTLPAGLKGDLAVFTATSARSKKAEERVIYLDNLSIQTYTPGIGIYAAGAASVTKKLGETITSQYEVSKTYYDETDAIEWSVSGVDGVAIDKNTGLLSVPETAGTGTATVTATLTASGTLPVGTASSVSVEIRSFAAPGAYELGGASTVEVGGSTAISLASLTDADGNDITAYGTISGFTSDNTSVAAVSESGVITASGSGTANISFDLSVPELGYSETVSFPIKVGVYELTSSEASIDVSGMISYGTSVYRVYSGDGFTDVTASGGRLANPYGGEVTVVPLYKLDYRTAAASGYTSATGAYSNTVGYGLVSGKDYSLNDAGAKCVAGSPLKVDLPFGRYDIRLQRLGTRADIYADGCQIVNNTIAGQQNRPASPAVLDIPGVLLERGRLDLTIGNISSGGGERISYLEIARVPEKYQRPTIWVAGDSESANYFPIDNNGSDLESDKLMMTGFGMQLKYFMSDKYGISDMGQPSATVKTWYDECFESVYHQMKAGDIILIDFGINEVSSKTNSLTKDQMKAVMKEIADAAKAKGAQPVLLSPVYCGKYQAQSYFTYNAETDSNDAAEFAAEIGIPFIDINKYLTLYIDKATEETGDTSWRSNNYQVTSDNLHLTQFGALLTASFICAGLDELGYDTTDFAFTYKDNSSVEDGYVRGGETGATRVYSVAEAKSFMGIEEPQTDSAVYDDEAKTLTITLADRTITSAVIITAVYSNGRITSARTYEIEPVNGKAVITGAEKPDDVFVWDSLENMSPLTDVLSIGG